MGHNAAVPWVATDENCQRLAGRREAPAKTEGFGGARVGTQAALGDGVTARTRRYAQRGLTLVELMAVVIIVGVLATIAGLGYRRYVNASRSAEVTTTLASISSGQEAYFEETFRYLDISGNLSTDYFPNAPGRFARSWLGGPAAKLALFRTLGVNPHGPVLYAYMVKSGGSANSIPSLNAGGYSLTATNNWFVARAVGDVDGNGTQSVFIASSLTSELYSYRDDE
jgi:type IV pilus assembly protein PilA